MRSVGALNSIYPPERVLSGPAQLAPYESDALTAFRERPLAVVLAESQEEVIETVRLCHRENLPFVARGSGTSLSGGSLPIREGIIIGLNRLNRVLELDPAERCAVVEPGVINLDLSAVGAPHGLYYAPDPSSQSICTIGGNVAFNSGGAHCLRHGMTSNHVLGLKAVLPDGAVVELGSKSMEGVGPDLTGFFVGSEGLFGIALEITVRLIPKPESYKTILAAYSSLEAAGDAVARVVATGLLPGAMEIMDHLAIEAAEAAVHAGYPQTATALLIVELEGETAEVEAEFQLLEPVIQASGAFEIRVARDEAERLRIWKGRKSAFSAVGRLSPDYIVQDGVVPRKQLGSTLAEIEMLARKHGIRVANVFHAGDGNLHPLILFDGTEAGALEKAEELAGEILQMCIRRGGSITGEHGVGMEKREYLAHMFAPTDMEVMRRLRRSIDPLEIANRRKMFPDENGHGRVPAPEIIPSDNGARTALRPESFRQVQQAVADHARIRPRGGGTKPALSQPPEGIVSLDLRGLSGIVEYEPEEYTFTALAGTPVAEVQERLAQEGQYLPFDPVLVRAGATLGGTVAAGTGGSGRYRYGGIRDFILGIRFVSGRGELVRGGSRVVKNAAGFDLPKLMVGSLGRLGILVEMTFKVFPLAQRWLTLEALLPDLSQAMEAIRRLRAAPLDLAAVDLEPPGRLLVRVGGRNESVGARLDRVRELVGQGVDVQGQEEHDLWDGVREFDWVPADWSLMKVPMTTSRIADLEENLKSIPYRTRYCAGGSLAWLAWSGPLDPLDSALAHLGLTGLVLRGNGDSARPGRRQDRIFSERIRNALDPDGRFSEA